MQDLTFELTGEFVKFLSLMESNEDKTSRKTYNSYGGQRKRKSSCSGNCLKAMSQLLYGSIGFHGKIREQAVTYIDDNRSTFEDAVVACLSCPHNSMDTIRK